MRFKTFLILASALFWGHFASAQTDSDAAPSDPSGQKKNLVNFRTAPVLKAYAQAAERSDRDVDFRAGGVDVRSVQRGMQERSENSAETQKAADDLSEQKQSLESEIRYEKTKLEAAQKKQAVMAAANSPEQSDKAAQEVKDWEARIKSSEAQLAQVENELQAALHGGDTEADTKGAGIILPGENLEIFVVEDSSFNGRYQVRRGGYIILPQVGRIAVAGREISGAEAAVRRALESSQLKHASVMIERLEGSDVASGPLIYLSGEFKTTRPYRIPEGTSPTLINVILSIGVTDKADLTRVRVERVASYKGVVEEVNVQKILGGGGLGAGGLTSDVTLNDGDVIIVPTGPDNVIYVTGNVRRQGPIVVKPEEKVTALSMILQAGGFARFADKKHVYVLRPTPDGKKMKIRINMVAVERGQIPDIPLLLNDIVVVPELFFSL